MLENYNIYSSSYHSNTQKTFYLALNKLGQPRKTHLPAAKPLGKLATYAKSFTFTVPEKRSEDLIGRQFGINHIKHGLKQLCDSGKSLVELTTKKLKPKGKCGGGNVAKKLPKSVKRPPHSLANGSVQQHQQSPPIGYLMNGGRKNGPKCGGGSNEPNCNKRKKNHHHKGGGRLGGLSSGSGSGVVGGGGGRLHKQKAKKQQIHPRKGGKKTKTKDIHTTTTLRTTTVRSQTITTTELIVPMTSTMVMDEEDLQQNSDSSPSSSTEHHEGDDDWDEATVPSMGHTAFAEDDDDGDDFDL